MLVMNAGITTKMRRRLVLDTIVDQIQAWPEGRIVGNGFQPDMSAEPFAGQAGEPNLRRERQEVSK
jgi:hypothetical protein